MTIAGTVFGDQSGGGAESAGVGEVARGDEARIDFESCEPHGVLEAAVAEGGAFEVFFAAKVGDPGVSQVDQVLRALAHAVVVVDGQPGQRYGEATGIDDDARQVLPVQEFDRLVFQDGRDQEYAVDEAACQELDAVLFAYRVVVRGVDEQFLLRVGQFVGDAAQDLQSVLTGQVQRDEADESRAARLEVAGRDVRPVAEFRGHFQDATPGLLGGSWLAVHDVGHGHRGDAVLSSATCAMVTRAATRTPLISRHPSCRSPGRGPVPSSRAPGVGRD